MLRINFHFRNHIIALGCCLLPLFTAAQGWQRFIGGGGDERLFALRLTNTGGLVAIGSRSDSVGGLTDGYWLQTDDLGNQLAQSSWGAPDSAVYGIDLMSDNWILGNATYSVPGPFGVEQRSNIQWRQVDPMGNPLRTGHDTQYFSGAAKSAVFQDGFLVVGANYLPIVDALFPQPYWLKLDSLGNLQWSITSPLAQYGEAVDVLNLDNQTAIVLAKEQDNSGQSAMVLYKINDTGAVVAEKHFNPSAALTPAVLTGTSGGGLLAISDLGENFYARDLLLSQLNTQTLDTLWQRSIVLPGAQIPHAALALPTGGIAIVGEQIPEGSNSRDAFLALVDEAGNLLWFKTYGGLKGDIFWDIQLSGDGNGFVLAGQSGSFSTGGDLQAWLVRTDSIGRVWSNVAAGRVVRDEVQNCLVETGETPLKNWLVTAAGEDGSLFTLTDSLGYYEIAVDTGTWFVSTLPPSGYWLPCEDSIELNFGALPDTLQADFPTQALYTCPLLDVDLTTPYLRRCFENTFFVRYFNYGTSTAPDARIAIQLDPYLQITGSDLPYTLSGDSLVFQVGAVPWLAGGGFRFTTLLDCDSTVLGQSHCTEAHIYPDSLCYTFNPDWDGSHLEVDGFCAGDSVLLTVTNTGLGMQGSVNFIITEDQIIFRQSDLQLEENQDTTFVIYPNGATVAIVVTQAPGHPGNSQPMLVVEGCGDGIQSTGYAFQFPQNDGDPSTDIECRANIGSFDPNDKTGLPLGVSEEGVIAAGTKLEYLIRFQNTGTDTAFRVEIRDQLSPFLDMSTLREGASSHPYRLIINGQGELHFLFDPIALPDSNINRAASQGFVKFSVNSKKHLPPGSLIKNTAAIYFDQNAPVYTNTTLHTIDTPIDYLNTKATTPNGTLASTGRLSVVPNPTRERILVNLLQPSNSGGLLVDIANSLGVKVLTSFTWANPATEALTVDLQSIPAGIYFIIAKDERGDTIARERIVKL